MTLLAYCEFTERSKILVNYHRILEWVVLEETLKRI